MTSGEIQIRVRYAETDRMGLLHHANYLVYFEQARTELEQAQRQGDLTKSAEIQYGKIPDLEKKLAAMEKQTASATRTSLLRQEVTAEDIARVVASWTGIPVSRMLESEREKLVKMEERLQKRVVGQREAVEAYRAPDLQYSMGSEARNVTCDPFGSLLSTGEADSDVLCKIPTLQAIVDVTAVSGHRQPSRDHDLELDHDLGEQLASGPGDPDTPGQPDLEGR